MREGLEMANLQSKISAFIGCWGAKTSMIGSLDEMVLIAQRIYEIDESDAGALVDHIVGLGKKRRHQLAYKNIPVLFPVPDDLWPAGIAVRNQGASAPTSDLLSGVSEQQLDRMMANSQSQLIDGEPYGVEGQLDIDPAKLLRKVVGAVISAGQAHILHEFPDVLAFFVSRMPEEDYPQ